MKNIMCEKGHLFDIDQHRRCPYCGANPQTLPGDNTTSAYDMDFSVTDPVGFENTVVIGYDGDDNTTVLETSGFNTSADDAESQTVLQEPISSETVVQEFSNKVNQPNSANAGNVQSSGGAVQCFCFNCFRNVSNGASYCPNCGKEINVTPKEPVQLVPGTILAGRYLLGRAIGSGGFGIVYDAWDIKLETRVAVKEFFVRRLITRAVGNREVIISKKAVEEFEYRKKRFLAEARCMAKFGAHRSIPNVFEFFEENGTAYIVMERLNGVALNSYLREQKGRIDIQYALTITNEVGKALTSLHKEGIIHKDVAPDNIYLCSGNELKIKLMDLGAAKLADDTDEIVDVVVKPGCSPIEQYDRSKNIGPWTDVYALGATLYVMLTGRKPDEAPNRKISDTVIPPHQINPEVSENLSNAVMKAMAVDAHMRFRNVQDFLSAINGERKVVTLIQEKRRRHYKRLFGIIAACAVLLIGSFFVFKEYANRHEQQVLDDADIEVWFSVADGSTEEKAMQSIKADFEEKYPNVTVNLVAIPESEYESRLIEAANKGNLPDLFESSGMPKSILDSAIELDDVMDSEQFKNALFLDQFEDYYNDNNKQMPLAIEVPMAYVITNGVTFINYDEAHFYGVDSFGNALIAVDDRHSELINRNFGNVSSCSKDAFLNNESNTSPVLLSSSMEINEIRTTLTNYEKEYVSYSNKKVYCNFIYEWSIGNGEKDNVEAAERLLSWMLGNVYQNYLMISECNDGQIPVNKLSFESKVQSRYLSGMSETYKKFVFEREGDN